MPELRLGLVGLGRLGEYHACNLARRVPHVVLRAVCALEEDTVDRVCRDRAPDSGAATCSREGVGVPIGFFSPSFRARGLWQIGRRP